MSVKKNKWYPVDTILSLPCHVLVIDHELLYVKIDGIGRGKLLWRSGVFCPLGLPPA